MTARVVALDISGSLKRPQQGDFTNLNKELFVVNFIILVSPERSDLKCLANAQKDERESLESCHPFISQRS